jgi:hypothetical protein
MHKRAFGTDAPVFYDCLESGQIHAPMQCRRGEKQHMRFLEAEVPERTLLSTAVKFDPRTHQTREPIAELTK